MSIFTGLLEAVGLKARSRGRTFTKEQKAEARGIEPAKAQPKGFISARVIRKDGTIEDLGVIAEAQIEEIK